MYFWYRLFKIDSLAVFLCDNSENNHFIFNKKIVFKYNGEFVERS